MIIILNLKDEKVGVYPKEKEKHNIVLGVEESYIVHDVLWGVCGTSLWEMTDDV